MTFLRTKRLNLRPWEERDRDFFHIINSDPDVMRFFPYRRDRAQADALLNRLNAEIIENSFSFQAIEVAQTGECVGFAGLHKVTSLPNLAPGSVEIGWRLARNTWGKGYATEAAREWLRFGFEECGLDEIVSFAVSTNTPSLAVMERIGMHHDAAADFNHPEVPDDQPRLKPHVVYRITREEWKNLPTPTT